MSVFNEKCYTRDDIAEMFRVSRTTATEMFKSGELPGFKIGGRWRITDVDLENYLAEKRGVRPAPARPAVAQTQEPEEDLEAIEEQAFLGQRNDDEQLDVPDWGVESFLGDEPSEPLPRFKSGGSAMSEWRDEE